MQSPEVPTPEEQRAIDRMIDADIDFYEHESYALQDVSLFPENAGWDD